ncbi:heat shock protein 30-like [Alosa pseudoharengus]|uniref:heat shock protein 30-like n=1 Tax=Alosa pseudoharengus TaxID=34774 RepID=UPI003F8C1479
MLSLHGFQPSLSPFVDFYWPVRSIWPQVRPLDIHTDLMLRNMEGMPSSLELLKKLQHHIFQEIDQIPASEELHPLPCNLEKKGEGFALTLDTKDFSPEELSVKQVGNKLQVSGKSEKRHEDGKGSYSYRVQAFRREFDLPEGVTPEAVTCSLAEGKLHIEAPGKQTPSISERVVPINCKTADSTEQLEKMTKEDNATDADGMKQ